MNVLAFPEDATSDDRLCFLTNNNAKLGWQIKRIFDDEPYVFTLGCKDIGITDRNHYKHIQALPEVLRFAASLDLDRPGSASDFMTKWANETYSKQIASLVFEPRSAYL